MHHYVEVTLNIYDDDDYTYSVGPYRSASKAQKEADRIVRRLTSGDAKRVLDAKYGDDQYNVSAYPRRMRTPAEAIEDVLEGDGQ